VRSRAAAAEERQADARRALQSLAEESGKWRLEADRQIAAAAETSRRSSESVAADVIALQREVFDHRRDVGVKFSHMDTKLVDDMRRILHAIQLHKDSLEKFKQSVGAQFTEVMNHEADQALHTREEFSAVRDEARRQSDKASQELTLLDSLLKSVAQDLKAEMDKECLERKLSIETMQNSASRQFFELQSGLEETSNAIYDSSETFAQHLGQLANTVHVLNAKCHQEVKGVKAELDDVSASHSQQLHSLVTSVDRAVQDGGVLHTKIDMVRVLLKDATDSLKDEDAHLAALMSSLSSELKGEQDDRKAAITEVYKRIQIARELDSMMQQIQDRDWTGKLAILKTDILRSSEADFQNMLSKTQEIESAIERLKSQEIASIHVKICDMEKSTDSITTRIDIMGKELSDDIGKLSLNVLKKHQIVQDEQTRLLEKISEGNLQIKEVKDALIVSYSEKESLKSDLKLEIEERRLQCDTLILCRKP
jgi:cytochrome c556